MKDEPDSRIELLKKDFEIMQANVDATLEKMRAENNALRTDIERGKNAQIKWIVGVGLGLAALFLGVAVYLG